MKTPQEFDHEQLKEDLAYVFELGVFEGGGWQKSIDNVLTYVKALEEDNSRLHLQIKGWEKQSDLDLAKIESLSAAVAQIPHLDEPISPQDVMDYVANHNNIVEKFNYCIVDGLSLCSADECGMHCGYGHLRGCDAVKEYLKACKMWDPND